MPEHIANHPRRQGETLRSYRHQLGLSLEQAAFLAGLDPATVSRIERGTNPKRITVVKLARGLGVPVSQMLDLLANRTGGDS